jgi:hypothetical protein
MRSRAPLGATRTCLGAPRRSVRGSVRRVTGARPRQRRRRPSRVRQARTARRPVPQPPRARGPARLATTASLARRTHTRRRVITVGTGCCPASARRPAAAPARVDTTARLHPQPRPRCRATGRDSSAPRPPRFVLERRARMHATRITSQVFISSWCWCVGVLLLPFLYVSVMMTMLLLCVSQNCLAIVYFWIPWHSHSIITIPLAGAVVCLQGLFHVSARRTPRGAATAVSIGQLLPERRGYPVSRGALRQAHAAVLAELHGDV